MKHTTCANCGKKIPSASEHCPFCKTPNENCVVRSDATKPSITAWIALGFALAPWFIIALTARRIIDLAELDGIIKGTLLILFCVGTGFVLGGSVRFSKNQSRFNRKTAKFAMILSGLNILLIFAFPNFVPLKLKAYDASARAAGRNAKLAQEELVNKCNGTAECSYAADLDTLLSIDKTLTDDTDVTFEFLHSSQSAFTFYTQHPRGRNGEKFYYHD